jgi:hypothetical protein
MTFKERVPVRIKIVRDNKIIEQVNSFNYLGNFISYEKHVDTDNKLNNYLKITGIIYNMFRKQKILKKTKYKQYNIIHWPFQLFYTVVKTGPLKQETQRGITAAKMKYMRKTARHTLSDYKTNKEIAEEVNITPNLYKTQNYDRNCLQNVHR